MKFYSPFVGQLRRWDKSLDPEMKIFLVTKIGLAPEASDDSKISREPSWVSNEDNACFYVENGIEDWHYLDTVTIMSDPLDEPEITEMSPDTF